MSHILRNPFPLVVGILALLLALRLAVLSPDAMAVDGEAEDPSRDLALRGDAACTACHDEDSDSPVLSIGKTRHGTVADARTPTCTSCHGEDNGHKDKPEKILSPPRTFAKSLTNSVEDRNGACLACHQGEQRMHWAGSTHSNRDVACTACHQIHTAQDKVRDRLTQAEICFTCHKEQRPR